MKIFWKFSGIKEVFKTPENFTKSWSFPGNKEVFFRQHGILTKCWKFPGIKIVLRQSRIKTKIKKYPEILVDFKVAWNSIYSH